MNLERDTGSHRRVAGRLVTVVVLAGLNVLAWQPAAHATDQDRAFQPPAVEKAPSDDGDRDGDGYVDSEIDRDLAKLSPHLQTLVRKLRAAAVENSKGPAEQYGGQSWGAFRRRQIEALAPADVAALAIGVDRNNAVHCLLGPLYREALFERWAARDPKAARAHVMEVAVAWGYRRDQKDTWKLASKWMNDENHIYVTRGHARVDPAAAWKIFMAEVEDPAMTGFGDVRVSFRDIMEAYAAKAPAEAWKVVLSMKDASDLAFALRGFMGGAPVGLDWPGLAADWEKACRALGGEPGFGSRCIIAARWVMDDPTAAFEWFCSRSKIGELREVEGEWPWLRGNIFAPPPLLGLGASDDSTDLKLAVLEELYHAYEFRNLGSGAIIALKKLAEQGPGQARLAVRFIDREVGQSFLPSNLRLLQVMPAIREPELRAALFLRLARAVPARGEGDRSFEYPNICLDTLREVARKLDVPAAVKEEAEANFKEVEAREAELRAAQEPGAAGKWKGEFVFPDGD